MKVPYPTPNFSQDFLEAYEERAAILEFEGGMDRAEAEAKAFEDVVASFKEKPKRR